MKPANSLFGVYLGLNIDLKKLGYTDTDIIYNKSYSSNEVYDKWMTGRYQGQRMPHRHLQQLRRPDLCTAGQIAR